MKKTILYENKWLSLVEMKSPNEGVDAYIYSHETRCSGRILSLLPFRYKEDGKLEYLLRQEVTPCWGMVHHLSSITGGIERSMQNTIADELWEESGYKIEPNWLIYKGIDLGICQGTKSCDTIYYLHAVDLTGIEKTGDGLGDGSKLENKAWCEWRDNLDGCVDPLAYISYYRLHKNLPSYTPGGGQVWK